MDARPSPRPACCDCSFPRLSLEVAFAVVRDLGFEAVDVCALAGYERTSPEAVVADPDGVAHAVRSRLDAADLAVSDAFVILGDPFETLAVNHPDPAVRAEALRRFEQAVRFAARIDAPGMTILPGMPFDGVDDGHGLELAAAELQRRAEIAGELGMALSVEPHVGSIVETPTRTLELLERAPDVLVTLDLSHFVYQGIPQSEADALLPRTRHVHLRQAAPGDMQARASEGTIDIAALVDGLVGLDFAGYLSHEYIWEAWLDCNDVDCVSETAELRDVVLAALARAAGRPGLRG